MKKPDFEQKFNEMSRQMTKISEMPNITDQMKEFLKLPKYFENMWIDGYNQGKEDGKNFITHIKKS